MQLPSLNVKGIECGAVGSKARNIVPNKATVSMDIRLVKGNNPRAMLELVKKHLVKQGYTVVDREPVMNMRRENKKLAMFKTSYSGYPAARTSMEHPMVRPLVHSLNAIDPAEEILQVPSLGGSLPLYLITDYLKQPLVIVPIANHDNNQHSPDENIMVSNLLYGVEAMHAILTMPVE